jgi:hypothetical protein
MARKATFLAGFATGYVLGSRAGRQRYEQIRRAAAAFAANPAVKSATATLQEQAGGALATAKEKATDIVSSRVNERRPAWISSTGGSEAPEPSWSAGSNGHVGP